MLNRNFILEFTDKPSKTVVGDGKMMLFYQTIEREKKGFYADCIVCVAEYQNK